VKVEERKIAAARNLIADGAAPGPAAAKAGRN
jgi:hypothetical protein